MVDKMTDDQQSDKAQADIDQSLLRAYQEVVNEDLPDRFKDLLERLRQGDTPDILGRGADPSGPAGQRD